MIVLTSLLSDIEEEGMRLSFHFSNVNPLAGALFFELAGSTCPQQGLASRLVEAASPQRAVN